MIPLEAVCIFFNYFWISRSVSFVVYLWERGSHQAPLALYFNTSNVIAALSATLTAMGKRNFDWAQQKPPVFSQFRECFPRVSSQFADTLCVLSLLLNQDSSSLKQLFCQYYCISSPPIYESIFRSGGYLELTLSVRSGSSCHVTSSFFKSQSFKNCITWCNTLIFWNTQEW